MKLATCCLLGDTEYGKFSYNKMTKSAFLKDRNEEKLLGIWNSNIQKTEDAMLFLTKQDERFHFFRISSDIFPLATLPQISSFYKKHISSLQKSISEVGQRVKKISPNFRIVTHPGQFSVINSKNPKVLDAAIVDLQYHYDFMSAFGIPFSINIHLGSGEGSEPGSHIKRFVHGFQTIPKEVRESMSLENDEKVADLDTCIEVYKQTGIKLCYDLHHQAAFYSSSKRLGVFQPYKLSQGQIDAIDASWKSSGMAPTLHLSNRREENSVGSKSFPHSDFLYDHKFNQAIFPLFDLGYDLEIEAKAKFPAVKKFSEFLDSREK